MCKVFFLKKIPAGHGALVLRFYSWPVKFSGECDEMYPIKRSDVYIINDGNISK